MISQHSTVESKTRLFPMDKLEKVKARVVESTPLVQSPGFEMKNEDTKSVYEGSKSQNAVTKDKTSTKGPPRDKYASVAIPTPAEPFRATPTGERAYGNNFSGNQSNRNHSFGLMGSVDGRRGDKYTGTQSNQDQSSGLMGSISLEALKVLYPNGLSVPKT